MMRAEIWLGGMRNEAYRINDVKKVETFGGVCKITNDEGWTFETSWHNVVVVKEPTEKGGAKK